MYECPARGGLEGAKTIKDWEERQDDGTQEDAGDDDGYDDSQAVFGKRGNEDKETDEEENKGDLEEGWDGRDERCNLPPLPRLESDLADEHVLPRRRDNGMPPQVLAAPLFCEDAEERRSKAEDETREPQSVDDHDARRNTVPGGLGKRLGGVVEERLHARWRAILERDEGEELDGCLRVVWLEQHKGGYEERCQDGGEQASLSDKELVS